MTVKEQIEALLADPDKLRMKAPFKRGVATWTDSDRTEKAYSNERVPASLPRVQFNVISQAEFLEELHPQSHKVLFDENIPSITMKLNNGQYMDIEYKRMAVSYQRNIRDKQVLHLCGNPMQFTLLNTNPTKRQTEDFVTFKKYWNLRNQDGMRTKMVSAQKSMGDAGLLFYRDYKGRIKSRLLCYEDGYVLCSHDDANGDRILESVYYQDEKAEYIDSYDDTNMYRYIREFDGESIEWRREDPQPHGFSEIPLVTKRGKVAWDNVQSIIEVYEIIYNIFLVIQKRHGWGILYIKGKFNDTAKKIAGAIVLNDTSLDGNGSAEFKAPPSPQNMIDTLNLMEETIQKGSGTTFLLPKDVNSSGDISAQAIMLTQSLDIENALQGVIEWQNVADKMARLFKEGLAKELVNSGKSEYAVTEFDDLDIGAKFKVWMPRNDSEYNQMLVTLAGAGLISKETGTEKNTVSNPDELMRLRKEEDMALQMATSLTQSSQSSEEGASTTTTTSTTIKPNENSNTE